jgi:hypothetical protein
MIYEVKRVLQYRFAAAIEAGCDRKSDEKRFSCPRFSPRSSSLGAADTSVRDTAGGMSEM